MGALAKTDIPVIPSADPVLIVFGCDPHGKPQAASFTAADVPQATTSAEAVGLRALTVSTDPVRKLAASLPEGRIAGKKAVVPRIKPSLYANLVAFAGEAPKSGSAKANGLKLVAGTDTRGGAKDKGSTDGEPHRPEGWDRIKVGSVVLTEETPKEGWYEAIVKEVMGEGLFKLTWQFWPHEAAFVRKVGQLALLPPKTSP